MSTETDKSNSKIHHLAIQARQSIEMTGITDVISFDEQTVILDTVCGNLNIDGDGLHVHILNLEEGVVMVSGRIDALTYLDINSQKNEKRGFFGRLLR